MRETRQCQNCGEKGEALEGVCRCGWNVDEDREATKEELQQVRTVLDDAIDAMNASLDAIRRDPRAARLVAAYDQVRAECRDDPEERETVIATMMGEGNTKEDAEHWVDYGCFP